MLAEQTHSGVDLPRRSMVLVQRLAAAAPSGVCSSQPQVWAERLSQPGCVHIPQVLERAGAWPKCASEVRANTSLAANTPVLLPCVTTEVFHHTLSFVQSNLLCFNLKLWSYVVLLWLSTIPQQKLTWHGTEKYNLTNWWWWSCWRKQILLFAFLINHH